MTKHPIDSFCDALRAKRDATEERNKAALRAWMRDHLAPKHMTQSPESNALLSTFVSRVDARLRRGASVYGDSSFDKPLATTADEILQELEDVAGWAAIAWVRIKKQLAWVDESAKGLGLSEGPLAGAAPTPVAADAALRDLFPGDHQLESFLHPDGRAMELVGRQSGAKLVYRLEGHIAPKPQDVATEVAHDRRCHSNHGGSEDGS